MKPISLSIGSGFVRNVRTVLIRLALSVYFLTAAFVLYHAPNRSQELWLSRAMWGALIALFVFTGLMIPWWRRTTVVLANIALWIIGQYLVVVCVMTGFVFVSFFFPVRPPFLDPAIIFDQKSRWSMIVDSEERSGVVQTAALMLLLLGCALMSVMLAYKALQLDRNRAA